MLKTIDLLRPSVVGSQKQKRKTIFLFHFSFLFLLFVVVVGAKTKIGEIFPFLKRAENLPVVEIKN